MKKFINDILLMSHGSNQITPSCKIYISVPLKIIEFYDEVRVPIIPQNPESCKRIFLETHNSKNYFYRCLCFTFSPWIKLNQLAPLSRARDSCERACVVNLANQPLTNLELYHWKTKLILTILSWINLQLFSCLKTF
jgi:hypothetical protein